MDVCELSTDFFAKWKKKCGKTNYKIFLILEANALVYRKLVHSFKKKILPTWD